MYSKCKHGTTDECHECYLEAESLTDWAGAEARAEANHFERSDDEAQLDLTWHDATNEGAAARHTKVLTSNWAPLVKAARSTFRHKN